MLREVLRILTALALAACRISNEDHCVHKALEADAWCAENVEARPYCSPCESERHGCVAALPDDCDAYTPDSASDPEATGTGDTTTTDQ